MPSVIYVARHGLRANADPPPTGIEGDPRLTDEGYHQAQELGEFVSGPARQGDRITALYASPFYRCLQTAIPSSQLLNIPVYVERGLSEFYVPSRPAKPVPWTAQQSRQVFDRIDADYISQVQVSAAGETREDLRRRVKLAMDAVIDHASKNGHQTIMIVTHAAIKITIAEVLTGKTVRCGTCSLDKLVLKPSGESKLGNADHSHDWVLEVNGETSFLSGGEQMHWTFDMAVEAGSAADEAIRKSTKDTPDPDSSSKLVSGASSTQKGETVPVLVSLDLSGLAPADQPETMDPANMHFAKMGTDRPIIQIGEKIYEGEWQCVVGTEVYTNNNGEPVGKTKHRIKLMKAQIETSRADKRPLLDRLPPKSS